MRPITARNKRRDTHGATRVNRRGVENTKSCTCFGCEWDRAKRPQVSAADAIDEGLFALEIDHIDDDTTEATLATIDFARAMFRTSLTRAEALWLGEGLVFDREHYDSHHDCCGGYMSRFIDLVPLWAQHAATERAQAKRAMRVTQDIAEDAPAMGTTVVLDDPDEMLSDEVVWDFAWDLVDYQGV